MKPKIIELTKKDFKKIDAKDLIVDKKAIEESVDFVANNPNMVKLFENLSEK